MMSDPVDTFSQHDSGANPTALERALIEALHDEYKARATYRLIIQKFGAIRPFVNILESEQRHIRALTALFEKYAIALPTDDWDTRVTVPDSVQEACQQGVEAEIENGAMYQRLLSVTQAYPDVQAVFLNLQRASQENHLRAFQRCAERHTRQQTQQQSCQHQGAQDTSLPVQTTSNSCIGKGHGHRHRRGQRKLHQV